MYTLPKYSEITYFAKIREHSAKETPVSKGKNGRNTKE
jgi:hypothetical protein